MPLAESAWYLCSFNARGSCNDFKNMTCPLGLIRPARLLPVKGRHFFKRHLEITVGEWHCTMCFLAAYKDVSTCNIFSRAMYALRKQDIGSVFMKKLYYNENSLVTKMDLLACAFIG